MSEPAPWGQITEPDSETESSALPPTYTPPGPRRWEMIAQGATDAERERIVAVLQARVDTLTDLAAGGDSTGNPMPIIEAMRDEAKRLVAMVQEGT